MRFTLLTGLVSGSLFLGMLLLQEVGRRWGRSRAERDPEGTREGLVAVEGAVYGLLGLLIAFAFSGAASRFMQRRDLVVQEANAIGTAYLRLDLLPTEVQAGLRDKFRRYLDARLEAYGKIPDLDAAKAALARSVVLQGEIWSEAVSAARAAGSPASILLPPALNQMIDITTTRLAATQYHPPLVIFVVLAGLALVGSLMVGHSMGGSRKRSVLHMLAYAGVLSVTIYLIFDLEYPRLGFIRVDAADQVLVDVRESMK